jgi:phospholipid/cholesterol/gamma-HCH transport system substrate-binding protein
VTHQAKVGIFAFITLVVFILGFYFLKGINLFSTKNRYYAVYGTVDGLYKSNLVVINGYRIGIVSDMQINPTNGKVVIEILSENDFPIPSDSKASIQSTDLVGGKVVSIILGKATSHFKSGDTIQSFFKPDLVSSIGGAINPLVNKISGTLMGLDTVLYQLSVALNKDNPASTIGLLNQSLGNIAEITQTLETTLKSGTLDNSLKNVESITANIEKNNENIDKLLKNVANFSTELTESDIKQTITNAKLAIAELQLILAEINKGDGTIGKLVKDKQMYTNLEAATANLDKLLVDVKENPYRYVNVSLFGGQKRDERYKAKLEKKKLKEQKK